MSERLISIFIVEDDTLFCELLVRALLETKNIRVMGICATCEAAMQDIPRCKPDIVLMDIKLPAMDGIGCIRKLKEFPTLTHLTFLILTDHEDSHYVFDALKAGASGYLLKNHISVEEVAGVIKDLNAGGAVMSPVIAKKVIKQFQAPTPRPSPLSGREQEVLHLIADGLMYKEIATRLGVSINTVRKHTGAVYAKLHVRSRADATRFYLRGNGTKM